jgi:hypothetical protein
MVMGFNIIFATMGFTISNVSDWAYKNYVGYYERTVARQIGGSAANIAASDLTFTPNWRVGTSNASTYTNIPLMGGTYTITTTDMDSARVRINVIARYDSITYTDTLMLGLSNFSKFAYFSRSEGSINWASGDTVWGPFHTQDKMKIDGNPVFEGRTTALNGYTKTTGSKPQFLGGFQSGVNIPLPAGFTSLDSVAKLNGLWLHGKKDIYIHLRSDGTISLRYNAWSTAPFRILKVDSLPFCGVIGIDSCNVHIKGTLKGRLTISCSQSGMSSTAAGNFWLDSSIVYKSDPIVYPDSIDMLGLVCTNGLWIKDTAYNNTNGFTLQASMLSITSGLGAEHYDTRGPGGTKGYCGQINLLGGIQQYQRQAVGTIGGSPPNTYIASGFGKNYKYDNRLMIMSPPMYPTTGAYEVLSWFEDVRYTTWFWQ